MSCAVARFGLSGEQVSQDGESLFGSISNKLQNCAGSVNGNAERCFLSIAGSSPAPRLRCGSLSPILANGSILIFCFVFAVRGVGS